VFRCLRSISLLLLLLGPMGLRGVHACGTHGHEPKTVVQAAENHDHGHENAPGHDEEHDCRICDDLLLQASSPTETAWVPAITARPELADEVAADSTSGPAAPDVTRGQPPPTR
jgi:hypothetical protein